MLYSQEKSAPSCHLFKRQNRFSGEEMFLLISPSLDHLITGFSARFNIGICIFKKLFRSPPPPQHPYREESICLLYKHLQFLVLPTFIRDQQFKRPCLTKSSPPSTPGQTPLSSTYFCSFAQQNLLQLLQGVNQRSVWHYLGHISCPSAGAGEMVVCAGIHVSVRSAVCVDHAAVWVPDERRLTERALTHLADLSVRENRCDPF